MNTLVVIGNGFDLAHNLPTRYSDFEKFLASKDEYGKFLKLITEYIPLDGEMGLWSSFEEALGCLDQDQLKEDNSNFLVLYGSDDWSDSYHHDYQYRINEALSFAPDISKYFREWVENIEISCGKIEMLPELIDKANLFLSFNYTNTLETVYDVEKSRILYIHGDIGSKEKLIVGHHDESLLKEPKFDENDDVRVMEAESIISDYFKHTFKNTEKIAERNNKFFSSLSSLGLERVYVLGHSLSDIDGYYFRKIRKLVPDSCEWHISFYKNDSIACQFVEKMKIKNYKLMEFK